MAHCNQILQYDLEGKLVSSIDQTCHIHNQGLSDMIIDNFGNIVQFNMSALQVGVITKIKSLPSNRFVTRMCTRLCVDECNRFYVYGQDSQNASVIAVYGFL